MALPESINAEWLQTLQQLVHYYLPPIERTTISAGGCVAAILVGVVLTFRSAKVARWLVCAAGIAVGALAGRQLATMLDWPVAVTASAGGMGVGLFAWRTHQWWLAAGSVVALATAALAYQAISSGDVRRWIPDGNVANAVTSSGHVRLPSRQEQVKNLYAQQQEQLTRLWERVAADMRAWGIKGWLVPAAGLVIGVLLAVWALRIIAVVWIALAGSVMVISGATGLAIMQWPEGQKELIQRPDVPLYAIVGLCLFGLFWQAKAARFGAAPAKSAKPAEAAG